MPVRVGLGCHGPDTGPTSPSAWNVTDVAVEDSIAYVADMNYGLRILDVSLPDEVAEIVPVFQVPTTHDQ